MMIDKIVPRYENAQKTLVRSNGDKILTKKKKIGEKNREIGKRCNILIDKIRPG